MLCFSSQYVAKNNSELHQRAVPKRNPVVTAVDEGDDGVERRVQRIPTIEPPTSPPPGHATVEAQPHAPTFDLATKDVAEGKGDPASGAVAAAGKSDETPHIHEETDEAREARLDKQWKQQKVDVGDLPDIYARLSKFKLTGTLEGSIEMIIRSSANRKPRLQVAQKRSHFALKISERPSKSSLHCKCQLYVSCLFVVVFLLFLCILQGWTSILVK